MPRGLSLATYGNLPQGAGPGSPKQGNQGQQQRDVSPDLVSKRGSKDQICEQTPLASLLRRLTNRMPSICVCFLRMAISLLRLPFNRVVIAASGPGAPPKPQRSFTALVGPPSRNQPPGVPPRGVMSPQSPSHGPQFNRPLPDRPYSVAGQYPSPDRRSFQDYSGYLSSPERRLPGQVPSPGFPQQQQPQAGYDYDPYGPRPNSVAAVVDDVARHRMECMERQLANLTGLVQKALVPSPGSSSGVRSGPTGSELRGIYNGTRSVGGKWPQALGPTTLGHFISADLPLAVGSKHTSRVHRETNTALIGLLVG